MKLILNFFLVLIFFSHLIYSQENNHLCANAKINSFSKQRTLSKLHYPGDSNIDVTYYKLDIEIVPSTKFIIGKVNIKGSFVNNDNNQFYLDLRNALNVTDVKSGEINLSYSHSNHQLLITLEKTYSTGVEFSVDVFYNGTPGSSGFGSFAFSSQDSEHAIWTLSEPFGASDWFPVKDTPDDKADSADIWVTVPEGLIAVSNGLLVEEVQLPSKKTYKWKTRYPIAQYLISLAITNYTLYRDYFKYSETDSMQVDHYVYPSNLTAQRKTDLDRTINMLEVFTDMFGEYPFINEKYGHAEFGWGGGMEHQTISSMGSFGQNITAHELAHQWFGDKITCKNWENIWLNEGFASYAELLYREVADGKTSFNRYLDYDMQSAKNANGSIYVKELTVSEIFNGSRSYAKGSVVLHMLRGVLGDENFFKLLKNYANDPELSYSVAVTEDFQAHAEAVHGESLDYFFQQWIYGENYPKYSYDWQYKSVGNGLYEVKLDLSQNTNTTPLFFTMPIDIKVQTDIGDTTITIFNDQKIQTFNFEVKGNPNGLVFDPDNYILKDVLSATDTDEVVIPSFNLSQNYPNPFNPKTVIEYSVPSSVNGIVHVKIRIYDVLGNLVSQPVNGIKSAGNYEINFNAENLSSGVYIYTLEAGNYHDVKKMTLIK